MKSYEHLVARVREDNPDFEAFFADMCERIPALKGRGSISIPPLGFKLALKTAYLAGDFDAMARLLSDHDETRSRDPGSR